MLYEWNWRVIWEYRNIFFQGALTTLELTIFVIFFGSLLGIIFTYFRKSNNNFLSKISLFYTEIFRALPPLVLIIWIFYVVPIIFGWYLSAFFAAALALTLNLSAFIAETFRAGLESVPKNQYESGLALGMTPKHTLFKIIIPQAIRNIIPNLIGLFIAELKNSSLASVIAVNELLHRSNILISDTFRPLEIYSTVAVVYLIMILPFIYIAHRAEKKLLKSGKIIFSDYETNY